MPHLAFEIGLAGVVHCEAAVEDERVERLQDEQELKVPCLDKEVREGCEAVSRRTEVVALTQSLEAVGVGVREA